MSPLLVLGCLAIAALAILISARFFGHPFSPFSVLYATWFVALALYNLHWLDYVPIRTPTWMLMGWSLVTFAVGWMIPYLLWDPHDMQPPETVESMVSPERLRIAILICFVLGVIWAIAFLSAIRSTIGVAAFIQAPTEIRGAMAKGGDLHEPLIALDWLNVANVALCSFYLFVLKRWRSPLIWMVLLFSLAALFLMQDRIHFFYAACWTGFVLLHSMKITAKRVLLLISAGMVLLLAQFLTVALWLGKVAESSPIVMNVANVEGVMTMALSPYMYITESFPSLQVYIDSAPATTHGLLTFYPLFRLLHAIDPTLEQPAVVAEFVQVPFDSNTFTWIHQFYTDFGTAGVVIGCWIIGIVTSSVYFHMLRSRTFYSTLVNGIFCYCLALSIFANHFTQGPAWYFLAICFVIALWVKQPAVLGRYAEAL